MAKRGRGDRTPSGERMPEPTTGELERNRFGQGESQRKNLLAKSITAGDDKPAKAPSAKRSDKGTTGILPGGMPTSLAGDIDRAIFGGPKERKPSAKREAAVKAYTEKMGKAPPKSMSIKGMAAKIEQRAFADRRAEIRRVQTTEMYRPLNAGEKAKIDAVSRKASGEGQRQMWANADSASRNRMTQFAEMQRGPNPLTDAERTKLATKRPEYEFMRPDPLKIAEKRNETARSLAEQAKATGVDNGRGAAARDLVARNQRDFARLSPAAPTPNIPQPSMMGRVSGAYNTFNKVATPIAAAVNAAQTFRAAKAEGQSTGRAATNAALSAAPGVALSVAKPLGNALSRAGSTMIEAAMHMAPGLGTILASELPGPVGAIATGMMVPTAVAGTAGVAAKVAGEGLKIVGRVAAPAMAAYGAYQGAKADTNKVRGAARGAIGALDPTGIVTNLGAAAGAWSDHRSLGERAFDAAFGKAGSKGQTAQSFEKANAAFEGKRNADAANMPAARGGPKGYANPAVQYAAQSARGVQNFTDWAEQGQGGKK